MRSIDGQVEAQPTVQREAHYALYLERRAHDGAAGMTVRDEGPLTTMLGEMVELTQGVSDEEVSIRHVDPDRPKNSHLRIDVINAKDLNSGDELWTADRLDKLEDGLSKQVPSLTSAFPVMAEGVVLSPESASGSRFLEITICAAYRHKLMQEARETKEAVGSIANITTRLRIITPRIRLAMIASSAPEGLADELFEIAEDRFSYPFAIDLDSALPLRRPRR